MMVLEKKPFVSYRLDEEKQGDKRETFTVSINKDERLWLNDGKKILNIGMDGTALKILARAGLNVLLATFGGKTMVYLTSEKRRRPIFDYAKNLEK